MIIQDTSDTYCHPFILPDFRYQGNVFSFLPRNLDNRNITVEEAEAVNEVDMCRKTVVTD